VVRRSLILAVGAGLLLLTIAAISFYRTYGVYGVNVITRRGGSYWAPMKTDDPRLSPSMRTALKIPAPTATPGTLRWRVVAPGFEVAELPVIAEGREVDRLLLSRIDPTRYRFRVLNDDTVRKDIDQWEAALPNALLIVNGSYFDTRGRPDTPVVMDGRASGPTAYRADGGAFVAGAGRATIVDLKGMDWRTTLARSDNAMVSYPLLIGDDGQARVPTKSRWLANRTFVGEDKAGRIIVGTTREAFFSLDRWAVFLKAAPLDLKRALNLDGGPIAGLSVRVGGFRQKHYAWWEAQVAGEKVKLLSWPIANSTTAMPMVLVVEPD
jgi:hypothetical protein